MSIALPNPEHHSPVPETDQTGINDLNDLVKKKVFSNFSRDELQIVRTVCRDWCKVINFSFGIKVVINNRNSELVQNSPWIVEAVLHNLTRPVLENKTICFAERLKSLTCKGMLISYNFVPLLQQCVNLEILNFVEPTIDLPDASMKQVMPKNIALEKITKLGFESWSFSETLDTIVTLLTFVKFSTLNEIDVKCVHPPILPLASIFFRETTPLVDDVSLIALAYKNQETLETLTIGTLIAQNVLKFKMNTLSQDGVPQLQEIHLQNLYSTWTPILSSQFHLTVLEINHCQPQQWGDLRSCITRCAQLLQFIKICGRTFGIPFECDAFTQCTQLEHLHLNLMLSPKRQIQLLPKSKLTVLNIDGPIEKVEMEQLQVLKELRTLQVHSLGIQLLFLNMNENDNPNMIDLRLFLMLLRNLPVLENLIFKDCTEDALDWPGINSWCRKSSSTVPNLTFQEHYFDVRGQRIQHGLTLRIPMDFNREDIEIPPPGRTRTGIFRTVLRLFGF